MVCANSHERHSRFDDSICTLDVHVHDLPHIASHIETQAARHAWCSASIANVAANAEWPDGYLELIAEAHDFLHFRYVARCSHGAANEMLLGQDMIHLLAVSICASASQLRGEAGEMLTSCALLGSM